MRTVFWNDGREGYIENDGFRPVSFLLEPIDEEADFPI